MTPTPRTPDTKFGHCYVAGPWAGCNYDYGDGPTCGGLFTEHAKEHWAAEKAESRNAVLRRVVDAAVAWSKSAYPDKERARLDFILRGECARIEAVLNSPDSAAKEWEAQVEVKAVARALVRMKQLGILVDKVRQPEVTARALLDHTGEGESE